MKAYVTPEMNLLAFIADQPIAAVVSKTADGSHVAEGSNIHNDVELAW